MNARSDVEVMVITPPRFETVQFRIQGTAPYMQARFAKKAELMLAMEQGSTNKKGKKKNARDFKKDYEEAKHISSEGWCGIPASAFRAACISACRIVGFKMTLAKLSVFFEADGLDRHDGTPLIRIHGESEQSELPVRNATGVIDIRVRPLWREWNADIRVRFDRDQFTPQDVANLLQRAGQQVGIGEGRPDSKASAGIGFGLFKLV